MLHELCEPSEYTVEEILSAIPAGLAGIYVWILDHLSQKNLTCKVSKESSDVDCDGQSANHGLRNGTCVCDSRR